MRLKSFALILVVMMLVIGSGVSAAEFEQQSEFVPPIAVVNTSFLNVRTGPAAYYSILTTVVGGTELPVLGIAPDGVWYLVSTLAGNGWLNSEFTLPRGDFSQVPTADPPEVEDTDMIMDNGLVIGGAGACVLSKGVVVKRTFPIVGPDGTGDFINDDKVFFEPGTEVVLLDGALDLFKVQFPDGRSGWVYYLDIGVGEERVRATNCSTDSVTILGSTDAMADAIPSVAGQPSQAAARVVVNTGNLNIRSGPGAQFTVVATVAGGTELAVVGFAPDGVWYLVEGTFGRGWLNSEFTLFRGDGRNVPVVRGAVGDLAQPQVTITDAVTLYAAPDLTLGTVGAISGPIDVPVVARTADGVWVQIDTPLGYGWIPASGLVITGDQSLVPVVAD
jgi:uncharacterized protein YraI